MALGVSIDTGGTFTDGLFSVDGRMERVKVLTTPHDLTVCFLDCLEAGARELGLSPEDMIFEARTVRYSTTLGTNIIVQRNGPRVGLIVSEGYEKTLYAEKGGRGSLERLWDFLSPDMVHGVGGEIGDGGDEVKPFDERGFLAAAKSLIDAGARILVVSLRRADRSSAHERRAKELFDQEYPSHYMGAVPMLTSTDVSVRKGDFKRTVTAFINSYLHPGMVKYLYRAEEKVRSRGFRSHLLIMHNDGGEARIAKTIAGKTYNSGPVSGLIGSAFMARQYGLPRVLAVDMGGTSLDAGFISGGECAFDIDGAIGGLPSHFPMIMVNSFGMAGGSIAWIDEGSKIKVGPQSAGAIPGPACFESGGDRPTLTDADVVAGVIDPSYFLGGKIRLNPELAEEAVRKGVAEPLGMEVTDAAAAIREASERQVAEWLKEQARECGFDLEGSVLFAYGGNGPTHCCGFGFELGCERIVTFPLSSIFSCFGIYTSGVRHTYTLPKPADLLSVGKGISIARAGEFFETLSRLRERALKDMGGEGFEAGEVRFELLLALGSERQDRCSYANIPLGADLSEDAVKRAVRGAGLPSGSGRGAASASLEAAFLNAYVPSRDIELKARRPVKRIDAAALKGSRPVHWGGETGVTDTRIYAFEALRPGNGIEGPAILESKDTNYVVPPGVLMSLDKYGNGIMQRH